MFTDRTLPYKHYEIVELISKSHIGVGSRRSGSIWKSWNAAFNEQATQSSLESFLYCGEKISNLQSIAQVKQNHFIHSLIIFRNGWHQSIKTWILVFVAWISLYERNLIILEVSSTVVAEFAAVSQHQYYWFALEIVNYSILLTRVSYLMSTFKMIRENVSPRKFCNYNTN